MYPKPAGDRLFTDPEDIAGADLSNGGVVICTYTDYDYQPYVIPNGTITPRLGSKPIGSTIDIDYNGVTVTGGARTYSTSTSTSWAEFTWTAIDGYTVSILIDFKCHQTEPLTPTRTATAAVDDQILQAIERRRLEHGNNKQRSLNA